MNEESYTDDADVSQAEQRIAELEDRIEQLEATTKKMMPTRRDALKFGGAAALGAAAMSGTASAGSSQIGTIGDASNLVDVEAEDINVSDTLTTQDIVVNGTATGPFGGGGVVFEDGDTITKRGGNDVLVGGKSFKTIFNVSPSVDVYGGVVYGFVPSRIRITFDSGNTTTLGNDGDFNSADTSDGADFGVLPVWPMKNVESIQFFNDSFSNARYAYQVFTT